MKNITKPVIFFMVVIMTATGCKTKKNVVVNARTEFDSEVTWTLSQMRGKDMAYDEGQPKVTLQINTEAGTLSGKSGCNRYFGNFKDLGDGKMVLSEIGSTKMACPESLRKIENSYMQLFKKCDGYELDAESLRLKQGDKVVLSFDRM